MRAPELVNILFCDRLSEASEQQRLEEALARLERVHRVLLWDRATTPDLRSAMLDPTILVIRSGTKLTDAELIAHPQLRGIVRMGNGLDEVNVDAAREHAIPVKRTPEASVNSVAELTMMHLYNAARGNTSEIGGQVSSGNWVHKKFPVHRRRVELRGNTLGIVGLGMIGLPVAKLASAAGMQVSFFDEYATEAALAEARIEGFTRADSLESLLEHSSFVSLHVPLIKGSRAEGGTHHLIGAPEFSRMHGVRLVNCARGGLVDEEALLRAMDAGQVIHYGADVLEQEPPGAIHPLVARSQSHGDIFITPHMGAETEEAARLIVDETVLRVREILDTVS